MGISVAITRTITNVGVGNQDITTSDLNGLVPKAAWFILARSTVDGVAAAHANIGIGVATEGGQWACAVTSEDAQSTTDTNRIAATNECIMITLPGSGTIDGEANFVSFITNGVRINWGNAPASAYFLTVVFFAGTDLTVQSGTFTLGNQDVEVNVNTVGFEPDIVLTGTICDSFNDTSAADSVLSHGCAINKVPIDQNCWGIFSEDARSSSHLAAYITDDYAAVRIDESSVLWGCEIANFDADGFSAFSRLGNGLSDDIGFLALSFDGAVNFWTDIIDTPTGAGNQIQNAPGFTPQYVHCGITQLTAIDTLTINQDAGSIGISTFDENDEFCNSIQDQDNVGTTNTQCLSDDVAINLPDDDGTVAHVASFVSFDVSGWTWNFTNTEGTAVKYWALSIGESSIPSAEISPTTPTHHQSTSLSLAVFKPEISSYEPRGSLIDGSIGFRINSYSHTIKANGGYWSMSFTINNKLDKIEDWIDRLGYHIEVYSPSLVKIWEGFIANASLNIGGLSVQRGPLSDIANRLSTVYSTVDTSTTPPTVGIRSKTALANDTDSQSRYGIIEKNLSIGGSSDSIATQIRDTWLNENALPTTGQTFNSGSSASEPSITIDCLGYVWFLNFYLYNQTANTGTRDISDIIQDVLGADPNGLFSTDYSRIDTNTLEVKRYTNKDKTAFNYIKSLVSKGDASDNRYVFGVYADRIAEYNAIPTDYEYIQNLSDPKQRVTNKSGIEIKPWEILPGKWLFVSDFLIGRTQPSNLRDDSRMVYLESISYNMPWTFSYQGNKVGTLDQKLAKMGLSGTG